MAILINEQKMVDDNTFAYEDRIKSPSSRLLDTTPTFTTYYHIDVNESTTDEGFIDVENVIGAKSPLRYNKIDNMPIYGLEQIVIQLQDNDAGIDGSYDGEATILPGTIKPNQNDYFIIPILKDTYLFRVTEITYDTIMPDNFYKISFELEYIDDEVLDNLNKQVLDDYNCILENIGTEEKCIIEKSVFEKRNAIIKKYRNIVDFYMSMFYNERHNVFLAEMNDGKLLYDPLQTEFINKHNLLNEKNNLKVTILTDEYSDTKRKYKYNKSIYRFIELQDLKLLTPFYYSLLPGVTLRGSSFYAWHEKRVNVLDIPLYAKDTGNFILSEDYINAIKNDDECENEVSELIKKYMRKEDLTINDIPSNIEDDVMYFNNSLEIFFFIPITLYIIKKIIKK